MASKDALFEDILNSWIDEINSGPIPDMDAFIKSHKLSSDDEDIIRSILVNVLPIKNSLNVDAPIEYKNRLMSNVMERYENKYGIKRQHNTNAERIEELLRRREPQVLLSYREKEKNLSDKDKNIIDDFLKELEGE